MRVAVRSSLSIAFAALLSVPPAFASSGSALIEALVAALNQGDEAGLRAFAEQHASKDVPAAERAQRMKALSARGAPFKLVRITKDEQHQLRGTLSDKEGQILGFVLELTSDAPPRLARMQLGPPGLADDRPAKDYVAGFKDLNTFAAELAKDTQSPGLTLAAIREGKLETAVAGVRELGKPQKVEAGDPFSVGSIGKPICSTVIGRLYEQGKLRFEMTLKEALPGVKMLPAYEVITLEQLMHHRGGVPEDGGFRKPQIDAIVGDAKTPVQMRVRYLENLLARAPIARPGERFAYSNAGYALLSRAAELAAGKLYEDLVRDLVFKPLGLSRSFIGTSSLPDGVPMGHVPGPEGLRPVQFRGPLEAIFAGAGGGIYMSAADLVTFGQAHLEGLRGKDGLLKASTVERLHRGEEEEAGRPGARYAAGWGLHGAPGVETWHGHNGSNGTFRAELAIFPKAGLVVAGLVNRGGESEPAPGLIAVLTLGRLYAKP